jgi:hypothetical protein
MNDADDIGTKDDLSHVWRHQQDQSVTDNPMPLSKRMDDRFLLP